MDIQKIQGHPLTFWMLTAVAVVSLLFAIWSHAVNQPKRELSYWVSGNQFANLDNADGLSLNVQGEKVSNLEQWQSGD
jgi:hypothetical protein